MRTKLEREFFPFVIKPGRYTGGEQGQVIKDHASRVFVAVAMADLYDFHALDSRILSCYTALNANESVACERVFLPDTDAIALLKEKQLPLFTLESAAPIKGSQVVLLLVDDPLRYASCLTLLELAGIPARRAERTETDPLIIAVLPTDGNPELLSAIADGFLYFTDQETITKLANTIVDQTDASKEQLLNALAAHAAICAHNGKSAIEPREARSQATSLPVQPLLAPLIILSRQRIELSLTPETNKLLDQLDKALTATGYDELQLVDTDTPDLEKKVIPLARALDTKPIALTISSLPATAFTPALVDAIKKRAADAPAIIAMSGNERLRAVMGGDASDAHIINAAHLLFEKGYTECQLNFMIGCPNETDADIEAIAALVRRVHEQTRVPSIKRTIFVHLSAFAADPHTPYQWDAIPDVAELERKVALLKRNLKMSGVTIRQDDFEITVLRALLKRADNRASELLAAVAATGEITHISEAPAKWRKACAELGIDLEALHKPLPFSAKLPWSLADTGKSVDELRKQRQTTSTIIAAPKQFMATDETQPASPVVEFGRGKKKVLTRNVAAPTKNQVRLRWGKGARTRFMSHLDNMRLLERCLRKANIPVAYSNAKRPTMKLSHCHPLPLGFTSEYELIEVTLDTNWMPTMIESLVKAMPDGFFLFESRIAYGQAKSLSAAINRVVYTLPLGDLALPDSFETRIDELNQAGEIMIERQGKSSTTTVNIRPAVFGLCKSENELTMTLGLGEKGYARPTEVFSLLDSDGTIPLPTLSFHRKELFAVDDTNTRIAGMDV